MPAAGSENRVVSAAGRMCRTVAAMIIAGFRRKSTFQAEEARIAGLPLQSQITITGLVLLGLFCCSLIAAQFGLIGLTIFWLGVIFLVR